MDEIEKIKKKRAVQRRNVTKIANKVEEWLESGEAVTKKLKHYESELEEK